MIKTSNYIGSEGKCGGLKCEINVLNSLILVYLHWQDNLSAVRTDNLFLVLLFVLQTPEQQTAQEKP
jgi:hypothetical protein